MEKGEFHVFIEFHYCGMVAAAVAVVRRGPDGDEPAPKHPAVALHDELVRAGDGADAVGGAEGAGDVAAEDVARL